MRRPTLSLLALVLTAGCAAPPAYEDVTDLFEAAGGADWCGTELNVTLEPFIGSCGDPTGDGRVVVAVSYGGDEIRGSVDRARIQLVGDGQLVLVPEDPDRVVGFQLRGRDRSKLAAAQEQLGGVILDSEDAINEWLGTPEDERPEPLEAPDEDPDDAATDADAGTG